MGLRRDDLSRSVIVHVCKDRTLSYRQRGEPVFNGAALPAFSVDTEEEAEALLALVGSLCDAVHPLLPPGRPWLKLWNGVAGDKPTLDLPDLDEATDYLRSAYGRMRERQAVRA
jgi:hypothetical protein